VPQSAITSLYWMVSFAMVVRVGCSLFYSNLRYVRVDCEFPPTYQIPGPYCEYRQDSRLVGTTVPNQVIYVNIEDRRRSNVSLVYPNLCRLTWAPLADEAPKTYTCRVYQGNSWKENSLAVHHSEYIQYIWKTLLSSTLILPFIYRNSSNLLCTKCKVSSMVNITRIVASFAYAPSLSIKYILSIKLN
uniref:Si:ch211-215c18.3 n=1 Tax=Neogobius melanostomus TaxID=47308 RepID=A0A8C6SKQ5_9GOBI